MEVLQGCPRRGGTEISKPAIVLFAVLIVMSISFLVLEAIVVYILVYQWKIKLSELRTNDFNYFSKSMQKAFELMAGVSESKTFVSIAAPTIEHRDEQHVIGAGPVLPKSSALDL